MSRRAFSLTEVLIVSAVLLLLAGIIFAVSGPAREKSNQAACITNLKNIHLALSLYATDSDATATYPELHGLAYTELGQLYAYAGSRSILRCPSTPSSIKREITYILPIVLKPINPDGSPSFDRDLMIKKEAAAGSSVVIAECTVHDELFYAPHEKDVDPHLAMRFMIQLQANGAVKAHRVHQFRDLPVTGQR